MMYKDTASVLNKGEALKSLLRKRVLLTNTRTGAKYAGELSAVRVTEGRMCVTKLLIINKHGGVTASKSDKKRWFMVETYNVTEDV